MILTLKLSTRVPGRPLTVDGQVEFDLSRLEREEDKGAFLVGVVERLTKRVNEECVKKSHQPAVAPSRD